MWNPIFYKKISSFGWNKWDLPNHMSSPHGPLTVHGVNVHTTEQFSAPWCLQLVAELREQQENNKNERYSGARAWTKEATGERSLPTPFFHLPCPNCHLLSFILTIAPTSYVIMMVPISPIRKPRSEKINIPHGSGGAKIWVQTVRLENLSSLPGTRDTVIKIPCQIK